MTARLIKESASSQARSHISVDARERLLDACARRAGAMQTAEIRALLPSFTRTDISYLRTRKGNEFGIERLLLAAERFGIPVEIRIGEAA